MVAQHLVAVYEAMQAPPYQSHAAVQNIGLDPYCLCDLWFM